MIFYINNQNGIGYCCRDKECFFEQLSEVIDELSKNGATYFDMTFETDVKVPVAKEIDIL